MTPIPEDMINFFYPSRIRRFWYRNSTKIIMGIMAMSMVGVAEVVYNDDFEKLFFPTPRFSFAQNNAVNNDSDVDNVPNIGTNSSSWVNAGALDGVYQNITEENVTAFAEGSTPYPSIRGFTVTAANNRKYGSYQQIGTEWQPLRIRAKMYSTSATTNATARFAIYNSSGKTGIKNSPQELLFTSEEIQIDDTDQWWEADFSNDTWFPIGQFWLIVAVNYSSRIWRANTGILGAQKSAIATDTWSDGWEDPFGIVGSFNPFNYWIQMDYSQPSGWSYQLDWEHQAWEVNEASDYYTISIYGFVSPSSPPIEEFAIQVWDWDGDKPLTWEDWGVGVYDHFWRINESTPQWFNYSTVQNIWSNVTWKYTDNYYESPTLWSDHKQHTLHIDYAGIFYFNQSLDIQEDMINFSSLINVTWPSATAYIGYQGNPIHLDYASGVNFDITTKGQNFPDFSCIWVSNSSDPVTNGAVQPSIFAYPYPKVWWNQTSGSGTLEVWVWVKVEADFDFSSMVLQSASLQFFLVPAT